MKKNDVNTHFWMIPESIFISLLLLATILNPTPTPFVFPVIAVAGVAACHLWSWKGVGTASACLMVAMLYCLHAQPTQMWFWTISLSLAIASTFVITTLCSEEAYEASQSSKRDAKDHKQTISHLNERLQMLQNKSSVEHKELNEQVANLQQELELQEGKKRQYEHLLKLAKNEVAAACISQEKLLQELAKSQPNTNNEWQQRCEEKEQEHVALQGLHEKLLQEFAEAQQKDYDWQERHEEKTKEHVALQGLHEKLLQELAESQQANHDQLQRYERKEQEIATLQGLHEKLLQEFGEAQQKDYDWQQRYEEKTQEHVALQELQEKFLKEFSQTQQNNIDLIDSREFRRIEGLYKQMRSQFEEKSEVLTETRKELFKTQEALSALQKDFQEISLEGTKATHDALYNLLEAAEQERILMEQQHQTETQLLQELVDVLMLREVPSVPLHHLEKQASHA